MGRKRSIIQYRLAALPNCSLKLKPPGWLILEAGRKVGPKGRRRGSRASCNDERHHYPLMFNEKQMSWLRKAGRMKRPWSESFPVILCLYWQKAFQSGLLQTDRPDERDSLLFFLLFFVVIWSSDICSSYKNVCEAETRTSKCLTASW